ncbi:ABC-2 family transporter protein [Effusibacillus pohliae]|uniref:ABC-2 family transporter protein n=1 Tax=Effusibacillus pohliae TaxID=232270 RepID=UPI00036B872A|nr:ABC-2 family transporter protein [Effusibacillus pohliae]
MSVVKKKGTGIKLSINTRVQTINFQFFITLITFMTYPTDIFRGFGRIVLFTVIPTGFVSYMPIGLLRQYSSGNQMGIRM